MWNLGHALPPPGNTYIHLSTPCCASELTLLSLIGPGVCTVLTKPEVTLWNYCSTPTACHFGRRHERREEVSTIRWLRMKRSSHSHSSHICNSSSIMNGVRCIPLWSWSCAVCTAPRRAVLLRAEWSTLHINRLHIGVVGNLLAGTSSHRFVCHLWYKQRQRLAGKKQ